MSMVFWKIYNGLVTFRFNDPTSRRQGVKGVKGHQTVVYFSKHHASSKYKLVIWNILDIHFTCAAWPVSCLVGNTKKTFALNRAQIVSQTRNSILLTSCYTLVRKVSSSKDSNLVNPSALDLRRGIWVNLIQNILDWCNSRGCNVEWFQWSVFSYFWDYRFFFVVAICDLVHAVEAMYAIPKVKSASVNLFWNMSDTLETAICSFTGITYISEKVSICL